MTTRQLQRLLRVLDRAVANLHSEAETEEPTNVTPARESASVARLLAPSASAPVVVSPARAPAKVIPLPGARASAAAAPTTPTTPRERSYNKIEWASVALIAVGGFLSMVFTLLIIAAAVAS